MKKIILPLITVSTISFSAFAKSTPKDVMRDGAFVQAFGGVTFNGTATTSKTQDEDFRSAGIFGVGAGYNFKDFTFSGTIDQAHLSLDSDTTTQAKISTLLANASYNFKTGTKFTPFVGVGLGTTIGAEMTGTGYSYNLNRQFVYQIAAGAKYALCEKFDVFADLKFRNYGGTQISDQTVADAGGNAKLGANFFAVTAGVSYKF